MSILIVEDNPVNATLLTLMLRGGGYQTVVAKNGKEALAAATETPDLQLIIPDYMMPEMDGLEFIAKVKTLPAWRPIPILIASAQADLDTVKQAQALQCADFLVKPIDKAHLLKRVAELIRAQPVLLRPQQQAMHQLECDLADYLELVLAFAAQVTATIPIVVLELDDSDQPFSDNLSRRLSDLAESASMLGAEKFVQWQAQSVANGHPTRAQGRALQALLQELESALLARVPPQPEAGPQPDTQPPA